MYLLETLQRLTALDASGSRLTADSIDLGTVEVSKAK